MKTNFTVREQNGTTCLEMDRETPVTEIFVGKEILVRGLLGELIHCKVSAEDRADSISGNFICALEYGNSEYEGYWKCTALLDARCIDLVEF